MSAAQVDILKEDARWSRLDDLARPAVDATLKGLGLTGDYEVAILGCGDSRIAELNADFRGKPRPTNVLSWPSEERGAELPGGDPLPPTLPELGDIAIAFDTCAREAEDQNKPFDAHVTHLIVHAMLHLLGFDHETDADAAKMEGLEVQILSELGLPDPYAERV